MIYVSLYISRIPQLQNDLLKEDFCRVCDADN